MRIRLKNNITIHKINNDLSLFNGETSTLYSLNNSAGYIVNGLKLGWDKSKIVTDLKERFGATNEQAGQDYESVLGFLNEKQLIETKK